MTATASSAPGPRSRALAQRLARVESRNITHSGPAGPVFWAEGRNALIRDADGNEYIDLTAGFGVAFTGHSNPALAAAIAAQTQRLSDALGDVHPATVKVELLERLAAMAPGHLSVSILASTGAEAVEAALKTALLRTGRPGIIAFEGGYHGLTYGALATTWRADFRAPFRSQLNNVVRFAPYAAESSGAEGERSALAIVRQHVANAERGSAPVGAIIVEPIQGRGGIVVPAPGFLAALRDISDGQRIVLIIDEVYTGIGRTGRWFACEHFNVVPDLIAVGKALGGGVAVSAAIGTPSVMNAWPPSTGEAIHTSTFLGNPISCAAALAQLDCIERQRLMPRAAELGARVRARTKTWVSRFPAVAEVRGIGLLQGVVVRSGSQRTSTRIAGEIANRALARGVLVITEGDFGDVVAITPPATITEEQLDAALDVLEVTLADAV
jgi:4-aminobutyrate aminotransferase-like enzyme